jgi:hypothetical protein
MFATKPSRWLVYPVLLIVSTEGYLSNDSHISESLLEDLLSDSALHLFAESDISLFLLQAQLDVSAAPAPTIKKSLSSRAAGKSKRAKEDQPLSHQKGVRKVPHDSRALPMLLGLRSGTAGVSSGDTLAIIGGCLGGVIFILFCTYWRGTHVLGNAIAAAIMAVDRDLVGVDLEFGDVGLNPLFGIFTIKDFVMKNAPGYTAPYLMRAAQVKVDIDVWLYIVTCGKYITVQEIKIIDANINYEKSLTSSNLQYVVDFSNAHQDLGDQDLPPESQGCAARMLNCQRATTRQLDKVKGKARSFQKLTESIRDQRVKVHKVAILNTAVTLEARGFTNHGVKLAMADMFFRDLYAETGGSAPKMIQLVLTTVMRSALKTANANTFGLMRGSHSSPPSAQSVPSSWKSF